MDLFIPKETLDILSYKSTLGRSLKQISLRNTPLQRILEDIERYRASYIDVLVQENLIGSRFKVMILSFENMKKRLEPAADSNSVLMTFLDSDLDSNNILKTIRIILEL